MTLCGDFVVHGAAPQRLALPLLPYRGTLIPRRDGEGVADAVAGVGVDDPERLAVEGGHVADGAA